MSLQEADADFFRNLAAQRKASNMIRHQNILSIDRYLKMLVNMFPVCFPL